jgi:hypothetical protein
LPSCGAGVSGVAARMGLTQNRPADNASDKPLIEETNLIIHLPK